METKFCPFLKAAGFVNGKEACCGECALHIEIDEQFYGCALAVAAHAMVCNANSTDYMTDCIEKASDRIENIALKD